MVKIKSIKMTEHARRKPGLDVFIRTLTLPSRLTATKAVKREKCTTNKNELLHQHKPCMVDQDYQLTVTADYHFRLCDCLERL